jgi:hypothetical protein
LRLAGAAVVALVVVVFAVVGTAVAVVGAAVAAVEAAVVVVELAAARAAANWACNWAILSACSLFAFFADASLVSLLGAMVPSSSSSLLLSEASTRMKKDY